MIEIRFQDFRDQKYKEIGYCLYVMKNGLEDVFYIGISTLSIWSRWFGLAGHVAWHGKIVYGQSPIGEKIVNHLPDSLDWKIQLWTIEDCLTFISKHLPVSQNETNLQEIEVRMIKILSPALNSLHNYCPGKDTTPKSKKELERERLIDDAYDEIFNK